MSSLKNNGSGREYWRSLDDLANTPEFREFVENEFPGLADDMTMGMHRRHFLKVMGASLALAGMVTGCRWPEAKIVPFARRPEGVAPGRTRQYATLFERGGAATGLLATSFDGRPIKVDGNPLHPDSLGGADGIIQASVLEMYDPDRCRYVSKGGVNKTLDDFAKETAPLFVGLRAASGDGLFVLSEASSSPSLARMRGKLSQAFPKAAWHEYESISNDAEREGTRRAFGETYRVVPDFSKAKIIVSLDADFLTDHPASLLYARAFADGRTAENGEMNRLYMAEGGRTITGAMADHRVGVKPSQVKAFAYALAAELAGKHGLSLPSGILSAVGGSEGQIAQDAAAYAAKDLIENKGAGLIVAGRSQDADVHLLAAVLNEALGNAGKTVSYAADPQPERLSHVESVKALTAALNEGKVKALLIIGGNPVYDAPADLNFAAALAKAGVSAHLTLFDNETARLATWTLPRAHYLEAWGDGLAWDGTPGIQQPLIEPLYGGQSPIELLAQILKEEKTKGYDIVRETFRELFDKTGSEKVWERAIHDGVIENAASKLEAPAVLAAGTLSAPAAASEFEAVFIADPKVWDGRFANNGWLQEIPNPLTKIVWDNAAIVSVATAKELGATREDGIKIEIDGRTVEAPIYVLPGQPDGCIGMSLGYGRTAAGNVGNGVGFNAGALRTTAAMFGAAVTRVDKTGKTYPIASTQDHQSVKEVGIKEMIVRTPTLLREGELAEYKSDPDFTAHRSAHEAELFSLWNDHKYDGGHSWGMGMDLSRCIGCNACIVACQAENNVPVVGKDEVRRSREMHWIRIDRYFSGDPEQDPNVAFQPVACQHCEMAPCEEVCPVGATQHSSEGLNDMAYNRCVGTRYCANNCPYKVRRFNFFLNNQNQTDIQKMVFNPDVTVRSRGVMEKCTFCVQRIENAKIDAKSEGRELKDGDIVPACQQTCPTRAIVFGDLNDKNSEVRKWHSHNRAYAMLEEVNVRPRNRYLSKLRNSADATAPEKGHDREESQHEG